MMKVFVIDDDERVCTSLRNEFPWFSEGFIFAGSVSSKDFEYSMIEQMKPDVIITDIMLERGDGFSFGQQLKEKLPSAKLIIISRYDRFEYVKKAITMGAADYLLKPVNYKDLQESLGRIRRRAAKEKSRVEIMPAMKIV